jgi:hypothetical protein
MSAETMVLEKPEDGPITRASFLRQLDRHESVRPSGSLSEYQRFATGEGGEASWPWWKRAYSLTRSMLQWSLAGFPITTEDIYSARVKVCGGCELWDKMRATCKKCGCSTHHKLRLPHESCPLTPPKWGPIPRSALPRLQLVPLCEFLRSLVTGFRRRPGKWTPDGFRVVNP